MTIDQRTAGEDMHHYLPLTDDLLQSGLYVTSAGRSVNHPGEAYPKGRHPRLYDFTWAEGRTFAEFGLVFITQGQGWFESRASGLLAVNAGDVFFLCPGVWHRYRTAPRTGWTEKWVQFNGPLAQQMLDQGLISPQRPVLRPRDCAAMESALDDLHARIHGDPASNSLRLSLLTLAALARAVESGADGVPQPIDPVIIAAVDYIWTLSYDVLSVTDVARAAGVTRRTLERHFAAALGHGVLEEIVRCRFTRAERLLRFTDLPLKAVTTLSGFGSAENMRQVFLGRAKVSPGAYRQVYGAGGWAARQVKRPVAA